MEANPALQTFLLPYDVNIQALTMELRSFITNLVPEANELIWDNYNAVAIAYSKSIHLRDAFCHIAVYAKHVNFGFNRGAELINPTIALEGKGKLIRHFKVNSFDTFPKAAVENMIFEAVGISESLHTELQGKTSEGISKVMSVSEKKRRPS